MLVLAAARTELVKLLVAIAAEEDCKRDEIWLVMAATRVSISEFDNVPTVAAVVVLALLAPKLS